MIFSLLTFGCKLNQAESAKISADLNMIGGESGVAKPNFIILNVCAVTHKAVREARQKISQLKRQFPQGKIVVTGCFTEQNWPGVDLWVSNGNKGKIASLIIKQFKLKPVHINIQYKSDRHRALIKIQTGCHNYCSYCLVPFVRGRPQSSKVRDIIQEIKTKERQGFQEIVLTGINIGLYNFSKVNLVNLLIRILKETNIQRIRLGSLWPTHITQPLINLYANKRLMPHFHLSIQSGSKKILKLMGRSYTPDQIKRIIDNCRQKIPHINFTTDIIVGFPGETEQDFKDSVKLITDIGFSKVHVFKYSKRPNTKATDFPNQVDERIKNQRSRKLIKVAAKVALKDKKKFANRKNSNILWETNKIGYSYGFTDNYIWVKKKS